MRQASWYQIDGCFSNERDQQEAESTPKLTQIRCWYGNNTDGGFKPKQISGDKQRGHCPCRSSVDPEASKYPLMKSTSVLDPEINI